MFPCLFFVLLNRIGLQGNHWQCVPQQRRPSLYGWEFMGQLCEKAGRKSCMYCTLSSLANFHLLGLMLLISASNVLMETQAANSLGFPAISVCSCRNGQTQASWNASHYFFLFSDSQSLLSLSKINLRGQKKPTKKSKKKKQDLVSLLHVSAFETMSFRTFLFLIFS